MAEVLNSKKIIAKLEEQSIQLDDLMNFIVLVTPDGKKLAKPVKVDDLAKIQVYRVLDLMPSVVAGSGLQNRVERFIELAPPMIMDDVDYI